MQKLGDEMSPDQIRAAQNKLGLETPADLNGRHVKAVCKRGGGSFHGKITLKEGRYYLKSMKLSLLREKMEKELQEAGFVPKPRYEGTAWSTPTSASASSTEAVKAEVVKKEKPKASRRNWRHKFDIQGLASA